MEMPRRRAKKSNTSGRRDISVLEVSTALAEKLMEHRRELKSRHGAGQNEDRDDLRYSIRKSLIKSDSSDPNGYERIIGKSDLLSVNFFDRGRRAAAAVCRIKSPLAGGNFWYGTGFLVGPRLLMTNNHVIGSEAEASQASAEFGYEHDGDGVLHAGEVFALAPHEIFVTDPTLDVTLVAVVPLSAHGVSIERFGRLPLIPLSGKALHGEDVSIIQHPNGGAKQIAIRASQIIEIHKEAAELLGIDARKFIHYTTDTEPGSSGSPVLNDQWQVVAIHHKAVPKPGSAVDDPDRWIANEGVRISAVYRMLHAKRLSDAHALAAVERIERALGMPSSNPAPFGTSVGKDFEADRKPLPAESWTEPGLVLGYDSDFLSTSIPLQEVIAPVRSKAASLIGSSEVVLDYMHFSSVIHAERKFPILRACCRIGASAVGTPLRSPSLG